MTNTQKLKRILPFATLLVLLLGVSYRSLSSQSTSSQSGSSQSAPATASPTLHGDAVHPAKAEGWVETDLYFGLGPTDAPEKGISEAAWREFLDKEVTTRFPAGLSVADIYGQWQGKREKAPSRIRSKMLIIAYPGTPDNENRIDAIRAAWKQKTGEHSVLKISHPADVSF